MCDFDTIVGINDVMIISNSVIASSADQACDLGDPFKIHFIRDGFRKHESAIPKLVGQLELS